MFLCLLLDVLKELQCPPYHTYEVLKVTGDLSTQGQVSVVLSLSC